MEDRPQARAASAISGSAAPTTRSGVMRAAGKSMIWAGLAIDAQLLVKLGLHLRREPVGGQCVAFTSLLRIPGRRGGLVG